MAATGVFSAFGLAILCAAVSSYPPVDAQSFLEIADSARDKVVPRPDPQKVPEFILIAELANKNKQTSPRPSGNVPDFVLIGESVHNSGGGGAHSPSPPPVQVKPKPSPPLPPVSSSTPDVINFSDFTQPVTEAEETTIGTTPSTEQEKNEDKDDFEEDKIYFEEWEKIGDPR